MPKVTKLEQSQIGLGDGERMQAGKVEAKSFGNVAKLRVVGVKSHDIAERCF